MRLFFILLALAVLGGCGTPDSHHDSRDKQLILYDPDLGTPVALFSIHQGWHHDESSITLDVQNIASKTATFNFTIFASAPGTNWSYDGACTSLPKNAHQSFGEISENRVDLNTLEMEITTSASIIYLNSFNG